MEMQNKTSQIASLLRPLVDVQTSMLITIKTNLFELLMSDIEGVSPTTQNIVKDTWLAEIESIDRELCLRN